MPGMVKIRVCGAGLYSLSRPVFTFLFDCKKKAVEKSNGIKEMSRKIFSFAKRWRIIQKGIGVQLEKNPL